MDIPIYRIDSTLPLPKYETVGAFAFDFIARETVEIASQEIGFIPGNLIVKCPERLALLILPRSSLARKKGLLIPNAPGLIDADYHGEKDEIKIQVLNFTSKPVTVERGERIAQGLFVPIERANFVETHTPSEISRGGFGSTGGIG